VWDARSGEVVQKLPSRTGATSAFSPDGRWLVTSPGEAYRVYQVESWQEVGAIPRDNTGDLAGPLAFSWDGKTLAVALSRTRVRLLEAATWKELATLEAPGMTVGWIAFTPDGSRLAVASGGSVIY